ncbi:hypothetical protein AMJ52_05375 [candidate division TA06 bacterium DG_78]|uniref:FAD-binding domain-containing protein n=1 Tax=candidate division TA06 bacterium DG_78 TaxID=1703772 RepID=A0A0S7YD81_UNCT6|nr:MAG: hypothetical protein AMJ52_05375 [candidate division TA06 bacterium DG_78]
MDFLGIDEKGEWIVKRMRGTKIFFPNGGFLYYPEKSYCITRTLFDQELIDKATKKGAHVLLTKRVVSISPHNKKWQVTTSSGEIFMCNYLIAADGATSTVRKLFGIPEYFIAAIQYKFTPIERFEDEYFAFFNNEKHHPGYAWIFSRGCETSIGLGGIGNVKEKLETFLASLSIDPSKKISVHYGGIPHPARPATIALPGVLFAGDAGGFTCPLTGGGIIGALMSGKVAGEVIRDALVTKRPEILSSYPERMKFHPSRSHITLFYSRKFFSLNNDALETLGNIIDQHIYSEIPMWKALRCFTKKPHWQTINAYMTGFAAQQILRHYTKCIF